VHLITALEPEHFDSLAADRTVRATDAGPSLEGDAMWFNMVPAARLAEYKKAWFGSQKFRRAISHALRRDDLCRIVFRGHAQPGIGPFSPANRFWFNQKLKPHAFDLAAARRLLGEDGFRLDGRVLRDRQGHAVEFSLITNAGNRARERAAAMMQQDLEALGIRLRIVTLDFPSLIERITKSFDYEACLLGLINVDLDPNAQMNVWLSSSANHQWNPSQKTPATTWEAEIDRLMRAQASTADAAKRKPLFDRVQEIVWEQAPFLYIAYRNALVASSINVRNTAPSVLRPQLVWNIDRLYLDGQR
jgi:peptide/nickel transport system substrate-binding protein